MPSEIQGALVVKEQRFAVVVTRANDFVSSKLLSGAMDALCRHGCPPENITTVRVPGSFELPLTALKLAQSGKFDAVICLGCLIRGDTPHFDHLCSVVARGVARAGMKTGVPVTFGVITADTLEQSIQRAGSKAGNKGADAAMSAIEMTNVLAGIACL